MVSIKKLRRKTPGREEGGRPGRESQEGLTLLDHLHEGLGHKNIG
jgi:hypothetical protein